MNEQGMAVADEGCRSPTRQLELAQGALRGRLGGAARRAAGRSRARQRARPPHPGAERRRGVVSGAAHGAVAAAVAAAAAAGSLDERRSCRRSATLGQRIDARPDLRAFAQQRTAAQHAVSTGRRRMKPTLSFTGNLQYQEDGVAACSPATTRATVRPGGACAAVRRARVVGAARRSA